MVAPTHLLAGRAGGSGKPVRFDAAFIFPCGFIWRYLWPRAQKPVKPATSNQRKGGGRLLELGQAIFIGSGITCFILLFQGVEGESAPR